jgi:hypothetical protein
MFALSDTEEALREPTSSICERKEARVEMQLALSDTKQAVYEPVLGACNQKEALSIYDSASRRV